MTPSKHKFKMNDEIIRKDRMKNSNGISKSVIIKKVTSFGYKFNGYDLPFEIEHEWELVQ